MSITFDTLKLAQKLETSGFSGEQAKGVARALSEELSLDKTEVATREGLETVKHELNNTIVSVKLDINSLKKEIAPMKTDLAVVKAELGLLKWMMGGIGFGVFLLVVKSFLA